MKLGIQRTWQGDIMPRCCIPSFTRYGLIYAGAQKNLGAAGVTLVAIRDDLLLRSPETLPAMLNYNTHCKANSAYNTPPVFAIYILGLVVKWLTEHIR